MELLDYSRKPPPNFFSMGENPGRFFGIEVETEAPKGFTFPSCCRVIANLSPDNRWYAKRDGSLDCGAELVSHPISYSYWQSNDTVFSPLETLRAKGFRSYSTRTCGMHVHVSRSSISQLSQYKLVNFFRLHPEKIFRVSRRAQKERLDNYSRVFVGPRPTINGKIRREFAQNDRYEAINLCPRETVEFRIFRGTLDTDAIKRNIAFVQAVISFVQHTSIAHLFWKNFLDYIASDDGKIVLGPIQQKALYTWLESIK